MKQGIEKVIAEKVKEQGGRVFYVGGYVRDELLQIENKDIDIEVHGIEAEDLYELLKTIGTPFHKGSSFGVYSLSGTDIDIALPRKEKLIGKGHRDFKIDVDPFIGTREAARRRDFTINALMKDVLTDEIIDEFGGLIDLKKGILRCVDPATFIEDPLRVLRAAQFVSRFEFEIENKTLELCKSIDLTTLSKERVFGELEKALLKANHPSVFFESLKKMNQLDYWFKEIKDLIGITQDPIYHPEGDVYTHTMEVLDRSTHYRNQVSDPLCFELLALCHDFGKITCHQEIDGHIHAYGHETEGLPIVESFISRITNEKEIHHYLKNMVPLHMKPNALASQNSGMKATNRMYDNALAPKDLFCFSICDAGNEKYKEFLSERLNYYLELMKKPEVKGSDLIEAGISPDENFSEYLDYAHKLHLSGVEKRAALKQTLSYIKEKE